MFALIGRSRNRKSHAAATPAMIESMEGRVFLSAAPATVILTVPGTPPNATVAGAVVNDKIAVNVANNDVVRARGPASIALFLSTDQTLSSDDVEISSTPARVGLNIAPGKNHTYNLHVKSFPQNLNGTYYIIAQIIGNGVNTTTGVSAGNFTVGQAEIDLAGAITRVPASGHAGKKIAITVNVANDGNIQAKAPLTVAFSFSTSSNGSNASLLADVTRQINIKPGKSMNVHFSVLIPVGVATGNNYLVADVDPNNLFNDPNLTNNVNVDLKPVVIT